MRLFESSCAPPSPVLDQSLDEEDDILLPASPDASRESPDENPRKRTFLVRWGLFNKGNCRKN